MSVEERAVTTATRAGEDGSASAHPWRLPLFILVVAIALGLFDYLSSGSEIARRGLRRLSERTARPPIYGHYEPAFSPLGAISIALSVLAGVVAGVVAIRERVRARWLVAGAVMFLLAFAWAVAGQDADPDRLVEGVESRSMARVVNRADRMGPRTFTRIYPERADQVDNIHARSHPPGRVVGLVVLQRLFPKALIPRALVMSLLAAFVLVPTWFIARRVAGERVARYAVVLLAASPGVVLFSVSSPEAVYATLFAAAFALLLWGGAWSAAPLWVAFGAGMVVGGATYFSYAVVFIAVSAGVVTLLRRPFRDAVRVLGVAALGGIAALILMRLVLGYDLFASYQASHETLLDYSNRDRHHLYWQFGNVAAWLTYAGVPIAALSLREIAVKRPPYLLAIVVPVLFFFALPADVTGIIPGETERTLAFLYPLAAVAAATGFERWERETGRRRPRVFAVLVLVSALQAVLLEALYRNFW